MLSKTKSSFYRRLYIAYLIDTGYNTIPKIQQLIEIPRRTAQDTIQALIELDIECDFTGALRNGHYEIKSWGPIDRAWVEANVEQIVETLGYEPVLVEQ
ncbi:helix-turn-helix domain-containing protein [Vibrio maerlii]|uniref:helix-turn-helix domain-containing protein n=1 Tax=Vibrio maerlii TaxID=2231648 RepID=UPI0013DECA09|nr:helix-turn-helix domain-containing protein [Vibrio maerlii]